MLKRAVIFTLDAIIAVSAAALLLTAIFFFISQSNPQLASESLHTTAFDSLAVLESGGTLATAVQGSTTALQQYLNALPQNLCGRITIHTASGALLSTTTKTGCSASAEHSVSTRAFITQTIPYYAQMEVWYA